MPKVIAQDFDTIPEELRALPQWVLWQGTLGYDKAGNAKITKVPYTIRYRKASSVDAQTWTTYDRVLRALPMALDVWSEGRDHLGGGIGFVFTETDPYVGVDLDHARDAETGAIQPWAVAILDTLCTYTEVSISGTGVHAICRGTWPVGKNQKGDVQIYQTARFFTMSGLHLPPYPTEIRDCQEAIELIHAQLFPPPAPPRVSAPRVDLPRSLTNADIIRKATQAKNGGKFLTLWSGDWSAYSSESEADMALCSLLAFWTQDSAQLDSLMRESGRYREKWDARRGSEETYGSRTIARALEQLGARFEPHAVSSRPRQRPIPDFANGHTAARPVETHAAVDGRHDEPVVVHSPLHQEQGLRCDTQQRPYPDAGNFATIFTHYPPWKGQLWWDAFGQRPMFHAEPIDDAMVSRMAAWCGHTLDMSVRSEEQLRRSLYAVAKATPRDPLQEFISGLRWDGTPRVATWLATYCGAEDTKTTGWIGTTLCCALVARAMEPGCMQRYMVILEGDENIGKSAVVRILGHPWARTLSRDVDTKDAQMLLRGCWVMEVPELDSFRKSEESRIKAFVSDPSDHLILKYENTPTTYPRRTVLIGTVNPDGNGYLKGQTGNTRYLPVLCTRIDRDALQRDRDQLYAEAAHYLTQGFRWWEEPEDIHLDTVREDRRQHDVYEPIIETWLDTPALHDSAEYVTLEEVLRSALKIEELERWKDRALQTRVGMIITRCGWRRGRKQVTEGKKRRRRFYVYYPPDADALSNVR